MCGKGGKSSSTVQIPAEVLARYNAVNARAEQAAATPFQRYSDDPNAFVAPVNQTQQGGISNISGAAGAYRPYFTAAQSGLGAANQNITDAQGLGQAYLSGATDVTGQALAGGQAYNNAATNYAVAGGDAVNPTALGGAQINQFMDPFLSGVVGSTVANLRQQQGQDQSTVLGNQIAAGAFGGDRGRIAQANLAKQQEMGTAQTVSGLLSQGYGQALAAAQQQQGVGLGAAQANRAATQSTSDRLAGIGQQSYAQGLGAGQQYAALGQQGYAQGIGAANAQAGIAGQQANMGTQAQQNDIAQGQAQIAAGTVQQQTDQAGKTALFNQFQQEKAYPFQTAQFLANIAEGTGAQSGNTTTTTNSGGFFSDARLKEDMEVIGKTFDGQKIVKFRYKGSPQKQIGLVAQDVEKHHPNAVGLARGFKTVDYDEATKASARKGHYARGGLVPESYRRYADGGLAYSFDPGMYPYGSENAGRTGGASGPHGMGLAPPPQREMLKPAAAPKPQESGLHQLATGAGDVSNLIDEGTDAYDFAQKHFGHFKPESLKSRDDNILDMEKSGVDDWHMPDVNISEESRGGLVARHGYAQGGLPYAEYGDTYVPDNEDNKSAGLKGADSGGGGGSGQSGLSKIANAGKDIGSIVKTGMKIAAFFSQGGLAGGRHGYATDGAVNDDGMADREDELQREIAAEPPPDLGQDLSVGRRHAPVSARHPPENMPVERAPGLAAASEGPHEEKDGNWFDRNRNWLIPVVKGLGTAAASNSRSGIGALLQGAAVAAGSYGDIEKQKAETANIRANKPLIEANVTGKKISNTGHEIENFQKSFYTTPSGQRVVFLADGSPISFADYSNMANKPPTLGSIPEDAQSRVEKYMSARGNVPTPSPVAPPVGQPVESIQNPAGKPDQEAAPGATPTLPQAVKPPLQTPRPPVAMGVGYDDQSRKAAARERSLGLNGGPEFDQAKHTSEEYRKATYGEAQAARANAPYLNDMATTLSNLYSKDGFTTAGYAGELRSEAVRVANTISRAFGGEDISSADSDRDILKKISTLQAQLGAQAGGQESNASLETIKSVFPGTEMAPDAGAKLAATLMTLNRRALDRDEHRNAYAADSQGLTNEAADDFTRANPPGKYEKETAVLEDLIRHEPQAMKALMSGRISRKAMAEKLAKQYGAPPSIIRYFAPRD